MELYNPRAVREGTAGVMSTMFLGEAYANFGIVGVLISPIMVGIIFAIIMHLYLKNKKTPLSIVMYLETFAIYTTALQAGFVDFIYSIAMIFTILLIFGMKLVFKLVKARRVERIEA